LPVSREFRDPALDFVVFSRSLQFVGSEDDFAAPNSIQGRPWQTANHVMPWILLIIASLFEVTWAVGLKFTDGLTRLWPTLGTGAALLVSVALLGFAAKSLPIGTAYAVWTGIGAAGTVICGIAFLGEPATAMRLGCVGLILAGVIGLKVA
jgi:quaternary ammonium compound-resistance protein SugE